MIGFHGIGILFHGICISFRCISLHFMNFVTFRFMSSKRDFATDGAPYKAAVFLFLSCTVLAPQVPAPVKFNLDF